MLCKYILQQKNRICTKCINFCNLKSVLYVGLKMAIRRNMLPLKMMLKHNTHIYSLLRSHHCTVFNTTLLQSSWFSKISSLQSFLNFWSSFPMYWVHWLSKIFVKINSSKPKTHENCMYYFFGFNFLFYPMTKFSFCRYNFMDVLFMFLQIF
jgi:hypothetical protein